jgi:hypothetical protein
MRINKFFLAGSLLTVFLILYLWAFFLPQYMYTDVYDDIKSVVVIVSFLLALNTLLTIFLALRPSS